MVFATPTQSFACRVPVRPICRRRSTGLVTVLLGLAACVGHDSTTLPPAPVATIGLTISAITVAPQQTLMVTATPKDDAGNALTGLPVTWTSSVPAVATIDANGFVTAIAGGMTTLTATIEGKSASVTISVTFGPPAVPDTGCAGRNLGLASDLVGCVRQDELWTHMVAFQQIADANPGSDGHPSRNSGEPGYLASVNYIANLLRAAGYRVTIQQYDYAYSGYASVPLLDEVTPAPQSFALGPDFNITRPSGNGDVTAQVQPVGGIVIPAPAGQDATSSGCTSADFTGFVTGHIALVQRGGCAIEQKLTLAAAAGAAGVIVFNEGSTDRTAASSCLRIEGIRDFGIPVVCLASYAVGQTLYNQTQLGPTTARLRIQPLSDVRPDYNLIADSPRGDPNSVVVVDAHLDAIYGAGMLDNASGSATILEIALKMAGTSTRNQLRYIWFGGEETGLFGSLHYTTTLSSFDRSKIVFDVDADVTATPNYVYAIADPANSGAGAFPANVVPGSQVGNNYFASYFTLAGLPFVSFSSGGTDSYEFGKIGVPNSGILTGQDCCKSAANVAIFGGFTGNYEGTVPGTDGGCVDRSFLWCDNLSNNDPVVLETVSKAFAFVVFSLANDATLTGSSLRQGSIFRGGAGHPEPPTWSGSIRTPDRSAASAPRPRSR